MNSLELLFRNVWKGFRILLKSRFRLIFLLFSIWLYRIEFIPGTGWTQILQIGAFIYTAKKMYDFRPGIVWYTLNRTNYAVKGMMFFYLFAMISVAWSYWKPFTLFITFQNLILIFMFVWVFTYTPSFRNAERLALYMASGLLLFMAVHERVVSQSALLIHHLTGGSVAAMLFTYSFAEWLNIGTKDASRKKMLRGITIFSAVILILSTSSGANAAALFGFSLALFFSKKRFYGILLMLCAFILFINQDLINDLILFIMPGKSMESVSSASGRQALWNIEWQYINQRPLLGWGFACVERAITNRGDFFASDAHNSYLGILGGLGYIGMGIFIFTSLRLLYFVFKRLKYKGFLGLLCALTTAFVNAYSFGFLSGKTCSITVVFLMFVALVDVFNKGNRYDRVFAQQKNKNI